MPNFLKRLGGSLFTIIPAAPPAGVATGGGAETIGGFIYWFLNTILLPIAGLVAVLFIIIGGFYYIFSGANEELAERGKKTLTNAIIGLIIVVLAYVIVRVVARTLGAT